MIELFDKELFVKSPKVSVCVVTYNQEKYIKQCLLSILEQKTDFDFEVIVGDDCSKDGTWKILEDLFFEYPEVIRLVRNEKNIGGALNYKLTHELARGDFVAHMDGDDLMLPNKLQVQVDTLEKNSQCVMVTHDMQIISNNGEVNKRTFKRHKAGLNTLWDLYETLPFFAHSSKMMRSEVDRRVLSVIEYDTLDIELHVAAMEYGDIFHIDEALGAYRVGVGMTNDFKGQIHPLFIRKTEFIYENALSKNFKEEELLKNFYAKSFFRFSIAAISLKNDVQRKEFAKRSIEIFKFSILQYFIFLCPLSILLLLKRLRNVFLKFQSILRISN